MNRNSQQQESPKENLTKPKEITSLDINFLKKGTWSYIVDIYEQDVHGTQILLTSTETQERINIALDKINKQGGKLTKILELEVQGKDIGGIMGTPPKEKCFIFVVSKE